MSSLQEQLAGKEIINAEKIANIRKEIEEQYSSVTSQEKAVILAQRINKLIDESLSYFSLEEKNEIRMNLVKNKLTKNQSISAYDIVEQSIDIVQAEEINIWLTEQLQVPPEAAGYINELYSVEKQESSIVSNPSSKKQVPYSILIPSFLAIAASIILFINIDFKGKANDEAVTETETIIAKAEAIPYPDNDLPAYLQYREVNINKLREWLNGRNSLLADEPYFSTILQVAAEFNINPVLLFAITGQEQGFVSRDHPRAEEIANNPFNVFHSWQDFNTNILESTQIAARTIVNLSKERPEDADPIQWINRKYAEDQNWWKGVSALFGQINEHITYHTKS